MPDNMSEEGENSGASVAATLDDLAKMESSMMTKMQAMMDALVAKLSTPPSADVSPIVTPVVTTTLPGFALATELTPKVGKSQNKGESTSLPKDKDGLSDNSEVPPPPRYSPDPPVPMPHIVPQGPPPMLDASSFAN